MMDAAKAVRLKEFFKRLKAAEPAHDREEALKLITDILNEVEDELTSIPYDPKRWNSDGRMYPPQADSIRDVPGFPTVKRYRSIGHNTFIGENGAIQIAVPPPPNGGRRIFSKKGADGRHLIRR